MKLDLGSDPDSLPEATRVAKEAEELGFEGLWFSETTHDPFLQSALAAEHTSKVEVGTAIALAFPRSPMVLAYTSWDLQRISNGRFILGLGSQVRGHVERRFGGTWDSPVQRMREIVILLRSIWRNWQTGEVLNFKGKFYSINLMTPFFSPGPVSHPEIPIYLAAVNPKMCELVGELCEGIHIHPFHSVRYLKEVVLPSVEKGARKAGRSMNEIVISVPVFAAAGKSDDEIEKAKEEVRQQIAFYASTKAYRSVLDLHGWGETSQRLYFKSLRGDWAGMASEITDGMLDEFAVTERWDELPNAINRRYTGIAHRVRLYSKFDGSRDWRAFIKGFHQKA